MPKFNITFTRTILETQEVTISAKDEDAAIEKAEAMIGKGLKESAWSADEVTVEVEDISEE